MTEIPNPWPTRLLIVMLAGLLTTVLAFSLSLPTQSPSSIGAFRDITNEAGITWKHFNGASEDRFLIEANAGGVGLLDFDSDGLLDIFLVGGGETPKGKSASPVRNALYRNLGNGKFEDVAVKARIDSVPFYGM